jgi:hypothetical protein
MVGILPGIDLAIVAPSLQMALVARAKQMGTVMIVWKDFPEKTWHAYGRFARVLDFSRSYAIQTFVTFAVDLKPIWIVCQAADVTACDDPTTPPILIPKVVVRPEETLLDEVWTVFQATYAKAPLKFERLTKRFSAIRSGLTAG